MQLGWVDYSRQERETIKELLKVLGESQELFEEQLMRKLEQRQRVSLVVGQTGQ